MLSIFLPIARLYLYSVLCTVRNVLSTVTQSLSAVMSHVSRMVRVSQIHVTLRTIKHEQVQQLYMERSIALLGCVTCHGMSGSYIIAAGLSFVRVIRTHLSEMKPTAIFWGVQRSIFIFHYFELVYIGCVMCWSAVSG